MFDPRTWLNIGLAIFVAVVLSTILSGCVAGPFVGPSTIRCMGGAEVIHYAPDYQKFTCGDELIITGSTSDNATTIFSASLAALAGWLVAP